MRVPGSCSGVKEGTWCIWPLPGFGRFAQFGQPNTKLYMPLFGGALLGPHETAEVEEGPY